MEGEDGPGGEAVPSLMKFAKASLIHMAVTEREGQSVEAIELACGRGEDVECWQGSDIRGYVGVDLAEANAAEAEDRWRREGPCEAVCRTLDPRGEGLAGLGRFGVAFANPLAVSAAFKDGRSLQSFCQSVAGCLEAGGVLLGLCYDGAALWARAQRSNEPAPRYRSRGVSVAFPSKHFRHVGTQFRIRLGDAPAGEELFLPHLPTLVRAARKVNLQLCSAVSLADLISEYSSCSPFSDFLRRHAASCLDKAGSLPPPSIEASSLFTCFAFKLRSP